MASRQKVSCSITPKLPAFSANIVSGRPFIGMLFTGVMVTKTGPKVLEFNARFGDPETQTIMMLLSPDVDLAAILLACCSGRLSETPIGILPGYACNVVIAAGGYPDSYTKGDAINLRDCPQGKMLNVTAGTEKL